MSRRPDHLGKRKELRVKDMPCSNTHCDRNAKIYAGADVVCNKHYQKWLKGNDHLGPDRPRCKSCTVDRCVKPVRSGYSEYCEMHYGRLRRGVSLESEADEIKNCIQCKVKLPAKKFKFCSDSCGRVYDYSQLSKRMRRWNTAHKMRAKEAGCEYENVDVLAVFEDAGWQCHICGEKIDKDIRWPDQDCASLDHNIALKSGGGHTKKNCRPSHARCNFKKAHEFDIPNAAKVRRMAGETGQQARRKRNGSKLQSANRWPKGRKIQSRGFS